MTEAEATSHSRHVLKLKGCRREPYPHSGGALVLSGLSVTMESC